MEKFCFFLSPLGGWKVFANLQFFSLSLSVSTSWVVVVGLEGVEDFSSFHLHFRLLLVTEESVCKNRDLLMKVLQTSCKNDWTARASKSRALSLQINFQSWSWTIFGKEKHLSSNIFRIISPLIDCFAWKAEWNNFSLPRPYSGDGKNNASVEGERERERERQTTSWIKCMFNADMSWICKRATRRETRVAVRKQLIYRSFSTVKRIAWISLSIAKVDRNSGRAL